MDKLKKQLQLSALVEQQKQDLAKLDQKYKELTKAYRVLQKEKEEGTRYADQSGPSGSDMTPDLDSAGKESLQEKLKQTQQEKSRLEAAFQQERNKLIDEKEELEKSLAEALRSLDANSLKYRSHIKDLRSRSAIEMNQMEQERANHQAIVKELQKNIAEEKQKREQSEAELAKFKRQIGGLKDSDFIKEAKYRDALLDVEQLTRKLAGTETLLQEKVQKLQKLEHDFKSLTAEMERQVEIERLKAATAEENLRQLTQLHEMRVSSLESRISELTETLCSYESLRLQDASLIASLKSKIVQFDDETPKALKRSESEVYKDVNSIMNQLIKLKSELYAVNDKTDNRVDVDSFFKAQFGAYTDHSVCEKEALYIKEELEQLRHTLTTKKPELNDNVLLAEISFLKGKVEVLQTELEVAKFEQQQALRELRSSELNYNDTISMLKHEHEQQASQLELKLKETRERLLKVVNEKDEEISAMKEILNSPVALKRGVSPTHATAADDIAQSLSQITVANATTPAGAKILHFVEDMSRKDVEISNLRRAKFELECNLREVEFEAGQRQTMLLEQLQELKSQIRQQDLAKTRETANLEYIKNVVFRYLCTSDKQIQLHLFNALSTILCFTSEEIHQVKKKHPNWK